METDPNCSCLYDVEGNIVYRDPYCRATFLHGDVPQAGSERESARNDQTIGRVSVNVLPTSRALSTVRSPAMRTAKSRLMASPSPVPS